jgi:hypothetical protein
VADRGHLHSGLHWLQKFSAETRQHFGRVQFPRHEKDAAVWLTDDVKQFAARCAGFEEANDCWD